MPELSRVAVVGAGVGGLVTAIALRQAGIEAHIFDKAHDVRHLEVGGGFQMWPNAFRALRQVGLEDAVADLGHPSKSVQFRRMDNRLVIDAPLDQVRTQLQAPMVSLARGPLQRTLLAALDDEALHLGKECAGYDEDPTGVSLQFADGSTEQADLVVAADGAESRIRQLMFHEPAATQPSGHHVAVGMVAAQPEDPDPANVCLYLGKNMRVVTYGTGDGMCWYVDVKATTPWPDQDPKTAAIDTLEGWYPPVRELVETTPSAAVHPRELRDIVPLKRWARGRVVLLGDAAHAMLPDATQGACQAIEDAIVLYKQLASPASLESALQTYQQQRIRRASGFQREARVKLRMTGLLWRSVTPPMTAFGIPILRHLVGPQIQRDFLKAADYHV